MNLNGCLVKGVVILLFAIVLGLVISGAFLVYQYFTIAASLPGIEDIKQKASQFETTRFYDRNGQLLYEMIDPNAGRRTYIPIEKISPSLIAATIAIEDKEYYNHPGFDAFALLRALIQNYTSGKVVSGASTITQQLARTLFFSPQERVEISMRRKAREIILAAELTRRYSKDEILELYLNEISYGNMAYGIEAAAETYFNTTASELTLAQSAFLAGLPQAPSVYDIFTAREATLFRNKQTITAMYELSAEKNCIRIENLEEPICVDSQTAADAYIYIENYNFVQRANPMVYPHWVNYIKMLLEEKYDDQTIYRSGFKVYTTLDPQMQAEADRIVAEQVANLDDNHATDGALVAIRPSTGEVLALTGSADFYNDE
ncbi:penicillin-binding protein, partial [bacterium]|nr:penicillin-binding protein [bacterium]